MKKTYSILSLICLLFSVNSFAQQIDDKSQFNCYTIIAGKDATVDGSVILGHNEDDWEDQMTSLYIVPQREYKEGDMMVIERNASIPQPKSSAKYMWVELMGQDFADAFVNEYGVAIASNYCGSREDREDFTDGGIGFALRRLLAERATSSRHAMELIGEMVERYGYVHTGRTYSVVDKNEGWTIAVVKGRHWMAQRVADDQVMLIPNNYIIDKVNLADTANFRASADIIDYAIERGWYDKERDGEFSFRNAYCMEGAMENISNMSRKWGGLRYLSDTKYNLEDSFPYQITPNRKVSIKDVMEILTDHYEGTEYDQVVAHPDEPHTEDNTICNTGTQTSTIFTLRDNLPNDIATVMWIAMYSPCRQVYLPWYFGTDYFNDLSAAMTDPIEAVENHFALKGGFREAYPDVLYWKYWDYSKYIGEDYVGRMKLYRPKLNALQDEVFAAQSEFDAMLQQEYKGMSEDEISQKVGEFSRAYHTKMVELVDTRL